MAEARVAALWSAEDCACTRRAAPPEADAFYRTIEDALRTARSRASTACTFVRPSAASETTNGLELLPACQRAAQRLHLLCDGVG